MNPQPFQSYLHAEETIRWQGSPHFGSYMARGVRRFGWQWVLMAAVLVGTVLFIGRGDPKDVVGLSILFGMMYLGSISLVLWALVKEARETFYAVTSQRALFLVPTLGKESILHEVDLSRPQAVHVQEQGGSIGTVTFGEKPNTYAFSVIARAREVYSLLQEGVRDARTETPSTYPADWPSNPFAERLLPGETFLWLGKPDAAQYVESHRRYFLRSVAFPVVLAFILSFAIHTWMIAAFVAFMIALVLVLDQSTSARQARTTFYAVTNQRVLIQKTTGLYPNKFVALLLLHLTTRLQTEQTGHGTLVFNAPIKDVAVEGGPPGRDTQYREIWFRGIADAQSVLETIERAKGNGE